jgi:hypothetical protein
LVVDEADADARDIQRGGEKIGLQVRDGGHRDRPRRAGYLPLVRLFYTPR